jgi:hypothetical protein
LDSEYLGDFETGRSYYVAYTTLCTSEGDMLCPIIFYIAKIAIDKNSHLCLVRVNFTIGLLNRNARNNPLAWPPLGYIPNIGLKSKAESAHDMKGHVKVQLYHDIVAKIYESLVKIQQAGGMPWSFVYKGNPYHVTLEFPVLVVMGDTEEHDKLCAHKACHNSSSSCRLCV